MSEKTLNHFGNPPGRIVVKLGSNVITAKNDLDIKVIESVSRQISVLMDKGIEVILVSSGAQAAGLRKMGMQSKPSSIPERQAIAAIGQSGLMMAYENSFAEYNKKVAQILLTAEDLNSRKRYLNARNTLNTLLEWKILPIINENDTIMIEEIKLGDNDNLSAMIALLMNADILYILTDIDGLYNKDPRRFPDAKLIAEVREFNKTIEDYAGLIPGTLGTGGMLSKLKAAQKVTSAGIPMTVANGTIPDALLKLFQGQKMGTFFVPKKKKMASRKCWIGHTIAPKGSLSIDDGAVRAVRDKGKSLLPAGIVKVQGEFEQGAAVSIQTMSGDIIGTGLVNYNSSDIRLIKGLKTSQIKACLGGRPYDEIIHRDNLVLKE
jgi:glutamate 5-kinase